MRPSRNRAPLESIEDAALAVALEHGLRSVDGRAVADRLQVPPRTVAASHPDDGALRALAFTQATSRELAEVKRTVLAAAGPADQLVKLLNLFAVPDATEVDALWLEAWGLGRQDAAIAEAVRQVQATWHDFIASIIRRGVRSGAFPEVDVDAVSAGLLSVMDGVIAYALVGYRNDLDRLALLNAYARAELGLSVPRVLD